MGAPEERSRAIWYIGGIIVSIILLLAPIIPVEETYFEEEPYGRQATYSVVNWDLSEKWGFFDVWVESIVTLRNIDTVGGTFTITHNLYDIDGLFGSVRDTNYIGPGQTYVSFAKFDTKLGQDTRGQYSITAPSIIDTRLVEKSNTVYRSLISFILH